ncbi:MAG: polysaccharide deacetylase family protein, partial [Alphaproteobacteria bacterium]|nr:polysaccharide deacetylase family protein [Alphaproteobacteria bacterium]
MNRYPRDLHGHGANPPDPQWPGGAKIAVQFVINYEEGGENSILHGDEASEAFLSEVVGAQPWPGLRHWSMESVYEYGARAGFWRLHRAFTAADIPVTVYAIGTALERSPGQLRAMQDAGWEVASHAHKWIEWKDFTPNEERDLIAESIQIHTDVTGARPQGWYTGRCTANTMDLIAEVGGFDYIADSYADDLPYWHLSEHDPLLVVPYTLDANDMRFATPQGFNSGDQFFTYLKDSFDALYEE